eukprot:TRINITY_DN2288_c0_g1_i7.p2 TRINITY_DN2288_c0_g1~~TRINITY_DN2288_c0_g1_i7.p2  ORF type:complete len:197 (-),score=64.15 TRINITY_DN2288_c0_g1_i7:438-1007(-)
MSLKTAFFSHRLRRIARSRSSLRVLSPSPLHATSASSSSPLLPSTAPPRHIPLPVIMAAFVPHLPGHPRATPVASPPPPAAPRGVPNGTRRVVAAPRAAAADDSIINPESTGFAAGAKEGVTDGKTKMEKEFAAEVPIPPGQGTEVSAEQRAEAAAAARAKADGLKEQAAIAKEEAEQAAAELEAKKSE